MRVGSRAEAIIRKPYYLPESTIENVGSDRVTLSLTADQIKQRGQEWTAEPTGLKHYRRV